MRPPETDEELLMLDDELLTLEDELLILEEELLTLDDELLDELDDESSANTGNATDNERTAVTPAATIFCIKY